MKKQLNSYELSRAWFDWCFENPEKISPNHAAIYFFAIEHCNRLGWKDKFGYPTQMVMDAIGIKKHGTYIKYFNDIVLWGFFKLVQKSTNQYSANIISLNGAIPKNGKALDKALIKHGAKQTESNGESNSTVSKPINNKQETINNQFNLFWSKYPKKVSKGKCLTKFGRLSDTERESILRTIDHFVKYKPFADYNHPNPQTYLNNNRWDDEINTADTKKSYTLTSPNGKITIDLTPQELKDKTKSGYFKLNN